MNWADYFYYDETSPSCLRWAVDVRSGAYYSKFTVKAGDIAGCLKPAGYYSVGIDKKTYLAHRVVFELCTKRTLIGDFLIDHLDGNKSNNRILNLRLSTVINNNRNRGASSNNTSGVCGVHWQNVRGVTRAVARWRDLNGANVSKGFSTVRYGLLPAFSMAVQARLEAIENLKLLGSGHTERHGK